MRLLINNLKSKIEFLMVSPIKKSLGNINSLNNLLFIFLIVIIPPIILFITFYSLWEGIGNLLFNRTVRVYRLVEDDVIQKQSEEKNELKELESKFEKIKIPYEDPNGRFRIDFATPYYSGHIVVFIYKTYEKTQILEDVNFFIKQMEKEGTFESVTFVDKTKE